MAKTTLGNHSGRWLRVLRPLFWWLLLVLVLFGIRTHQRLMENTRVEFSVNMNGQSLINDSATTARLDGRSVTTHQRISLGSHTLMVSNPKAELFQTNFFAWYGRRDFGEIKLQRAFGTLSISDSPPATTITITGPEFSTTLSNIIGMNLDVPTDHYVINAEYPHWSQSQNVMVSANLTAPCVFFPRLGALRLTCNKEEVTYDLHFINGQSVDWGNVPAVVSGLAAGSYQLTAEYHRHQLKKSVLVEPGETNEVPLEFTFGALHLETVPTGAEVRTSDGHYLGVTPLDLSDITPRMAQLSLSLSGYASMPVTLEITANQTASLSTNLISVSYVTAMRHARADLAEGNYNRVVEATTTALNVMPNDTDALALQDQANGHLNAEHERLGQLKQPRETFAAMCNQNPDSSLFGEHALKTSQPAKEVAGAIAKSLQDEPHPFEILYNDSPKPEIYKIMARQTFSLGILGGTERVCLIVVGQTKSDETQIFYKVLEYQIKNTLSANGLFSIKDNKQMIPVSPGRIQMTDGLQNQIREGVKIVRERIHSTTGQVQ